VVKLRPCDYYATPVFRGFRYTEGPAFRVFTISWTLYLVVKFFFGSEFPIETFFQEYTSVLKKLALNLPSIETF
jgi:hypothetical protein